MVNVTQEANMTAAGEVLVASSSFVPPMQRLVTETPAGGGGYGVWVASSEPTEPEERTIAGIPVRLLWVPYVGLGFILVLLMLVSFIRYHRKHGHKYQQRRLELWKKFHMENLENMLDHLQEGVETVGGIARGPPPPNGGLNISPSTSTPHQDPPPAAKAKKKRRRPIFFTTNTNGSMVDIRCSNSSQTFRSNNEQAAAAEAAAAEFTASHSSAPTLQPLQATQSLSAAPNRGKSKAKTRGLAQGLTPDNTPPMLPLLPGPSPSQYKLKSSPVIWTLTRPRSLRGVSRTPAAFFSSPMDIQADEIEVEDDEVFLLSQTPL